MVIITGDNKVIIESFVFPIITLFITTMQFIYLITNSLVYNPTINFFILRMPFLTVRLRFRSVFLPVKLLLDGYVLCIWCGN